MGAWIEMCWETCYSKLYIVAPLVGAWIEIVRCYRTLTRPCVAPLVGAWIEIIVKVGNDIGVVGRSPCGSVD